MSFYKTYKNMYDNPFYSKKGQVIKQKPTNIPPKIEKSMIIPARSFLKTKDEYFIGPNEDPETVDIPYYTLTNGYISHFFRSEEYDYSSPRSEVKWDISDIVPSSIKDALLNEYLELSDDGYIFAYCTVSVDFFWASYSNMPSGSHVYIYALNHGDEYAISNHFIVGKNIKIFGYLNIGDGSQVFSDVIDADVGEMNTTLIYPAEGKQNGFVSYDINDIVLFEKLIYGEESLGIELLRFKTDVDKAPDFYFSLSFHVRYEKKESLRPTIDL